MSVDQWAFLISLLLGAVLLVRYALIARTRAAWATLVGFAAAVAVLGSLFGLLTNPFAGSLWSKGAGEIPWGDILRLALLYIAMALGMLAQYLHARYSQPQRFRPKFDLGLFLAPILLSPIIFLPIAQTLSEAPSSVRSGLAALLVAFQNGFFFKSYFEHERRKHVG